MPVRRQTVETILGGSPMLLRHQAFGGVAVAALAALAIVSARALDVGSLGEIGPGMFPMALASLLLMLGFIVAITSSRTVDEDGPGFTVQSARGLVAILGAVIFFGLTIRPLGLALATPIAIMISGFADSETRWIDLAIFAIGLTVFCLALFRFALGLPIPFAPWAIGY
jgi:putative tricarboxylic transport membrane protein